MLGYQSPTYQSNVYQPPRSGLGSSVYSLLKQAIQAYLTGGVSGLSTGTGFKAGGMQGLGLGQGIPKGQMLGLGQGLGKSSEPSLLGQFSQRKPFGASSGMQGLGQGSGLGLGQTNQNQYGLMNILRLLGR